MGPRGAGIRVPVKLGYGGFPSAGRVSQKLGEDKGKDEREEKGEGRREMRNGKWYRETVGSQYSQGSKSQYDLKRLGGRTQN